jgi:hypothetical protein
MKTHNHHYTKVKLEQAAMLMEFASLSELYTYSETYQLNNIFILSGNEDEALQFAVVHNNVLMRHATMGYETLADFHLSFQNDFPDAATYYAALAEGYKKYEEYKLVKEAGIASKDVFEKMRNNGFIKGFTDFNEMLLSGDRLPQIEHFANPYLLYKFAVDNGFANYNEFKEAFVKGFTDSITMKIAAENGFANGADYKEAITLGFRNNAELQLARKEKIRDSADLSRREELAFTGNNENSFDQRLLMVLLSKIEQGKKISLNKLHDLFQKSLDEYRYADSNEVPGWFTKAFDDPEQLISFLQKEVQLKKYGEYDADGGFFQINLMQDRKVVIDGSNVAYNSNGNNASKPYVSNLLKLTAFLQKKGFSEITVIADASLKRKLADAEKLAELEKRVDYLIAPSENPADVFIINYVKTTHCLLVSNDNFREWKMLDPWVAANIDFYKLSFMIKGEEVLMPDLK